MVYVAAVKNMDDDERFRFDLQVFGPPDEDEWLTDPAAIAAQERLMALAGGADGDYGVAP